MRSVRLRGAVHGWEAGERLRVRLPRGSSEAHRPGGDDWLVSLGFFLFMLGAAVIALAYGVSARQTRSVQRVMMAGFVVVAAAVPVPFIAWLVTRWS